MTDRQTVQLKTWAVCQICGLALPREKTQPEDGWLVSPYRSDPSLDVVRCPAHISEWSLRCSEAGRTTFWRQKMQEGKGWTPGYDHLLAPIPIHDVR